MTMKMKMMKSMLVLVKLTKRVRKTAMKSRLCICPKSLAGDVADMSATCRPDSQTMLAHLACMPLSWQHKIDPDTTFWCR